MGPTSNSFDRSAEQPKTYDFSARYHLQSDTMTYVRIATGYRPGTPNQVIPGYPQIPLQTNSDTMVNYEIGIKSELINRKASLDLALYKINWSDIQVYVPTPDGQFYYVINAGKATSEGVEFAATYSPVDALHFEGNAAYADVFATEAVPSANIFAGTRMPGSPRWTAAAALDLSLWNLGHWTPRLRGTWRYIAPELSSLSSAPPVGQMPGYSWVDLELRMTKGRYDVALYAKNLTDKRAFNNGGPFTANTAGPNAPLPPGPPSPSFGGVPIEPRVVGVSVTVSL
jgi:outer membrane receptor protein involved in Fe transport